jgi:inorganic pyrophosphatase
MAVRSIVALLAVLIAGPLAAENPPAHAPQPIVGERSFLDGYPARNEDGTINVVVECPAGTITKWEVNPDGVLRVQEDYLGIGWQGLSAVDFLAYPANYGMIPGTLMAREVGGDGEPLDVMVLGDAVERGTVARARLIGAIALLDDAEQDDKLLAVLDDSPLGDVRDVADLDERYAGVTAILETWLVNYKGAGKLTSYGFVGPVAAERLLDAAVSSFDEERGSAVAAAGD